MEFCRILFLKLLIKMHFQLFNDKTITNKNIECWDCSEISILATYKNDTVRLMRKSDVSDRIFFPLTEAINNYLSTNKSRSKFNAFPQLKFETAALIGPSMPP